MCAFGAKAFAPHMSAFDPKRTFQSTASDAQLNMCRLSSSGQAIWQIKLVFARAVASANLRQCKDRTAPLFFRTGI
jgi:hypothetical protein